MNKIFIIGLPRTGTTSVCAAMLELGFSVAHTAYTERAFFEAQVIADTPIFCDYQHLDKAYPDAKFIYLTRTMDKWLPSIGQLLARMHVNLIRDDGGFNPIIKRCYQAIFSPYSSENINNIEFLAQCYQQHEKQVLEYFQDRADDLLTIDVSVNQNYAQLLKFLDIKDSEAKGLGFKKLNVGGKVTAWKDIKSELKVESTNKGRVTKLPYL
ncbi:sulfotransferase family protein [Colwellia sp. BRX10-3]|uniref:sulfotransferase family protein n=1 Tax=Colwellia sp. BRX10-3 TaxID=2759844 RepID=UPI0015F747C2|nr:sulfotransferase family protein [Colwellia sp. BRX10-3]MBA6391703.1 sulfotransferase family protein [Colwellia sp. BRX10-3]